jgi:hypothetical protein
MRSESRAGDGRPTERSPTALVRSPGRGYPGDMKITPLAAVALAGFAVISAANPIAHDWRAEKTRSAAYYDAYQKHFLGNPDAQSMITDVRSMAADVERKEKRRDSATKDLLAARGLDSPRKRAAASDALTDLRLDYFYGNMLPSILNEFDDGIIKQGAPRPFPVRPLSITKKEFKSEQARLIARIGLSPDEIDPKPASDDPHSFSGFRVSAR